MNPTFNASLESQSVDLVLQNLQDGNIELSPTYQRGDVWTSQMRSEFIDSILNGIVPTNIIVNKEFCSNSVKLTCIDGKQRLTSIRMFRENKIPHISKQDHDDEKEIHTYFDKNPEFKNNDIVYNVLNNEAKFKLFLDRKIPVAYYSNLSYDQQVDIFRRINHSSPATKGEILISKFSNDNAAKKLKSFLDICNFMNEKRAQHHDNILNIMYMIYNDDLKLLSSGGKQRESDFIKIIDNDRIMIDLIAGSKDFISVYYSTKILQHRDIKKLNMNNCFKNAIGYMIYEKFKNPAKIPTLIRNLISNVWNIWNCTDNKDRNKKTDKALKNLKTIFDKMYEDATPDTSDSNKMIIKKKKNDSNKNSPKRSKAIKKVIKLVNKKSNNESDDAMDDEVDPESESDSGSDPDNGLQLKKKIINNHTK
jgi:hypothetical protein